MGRYRIGIAIHSFEGLYHGLLYKGFCSEAAELGMDIVFFPGTELDNGRNTYTDSAGTVYNLLNPGNVDGLIAVATSLFTNSDNESRRHSLARFADIPLVTLGDSLGICPTVEINATPGIREAVHHLVADHGYRRLGLITGPGEGWESANRTKAFIDALKEHGLALDAEHRCSGDFTEDSGARAVHRLNEEGNLTMEALFIENDEMAVGAVKALDELNLKVPEDIAIIGFDDIPHLASMSPPMATVRQPVQQQAAEALRLILKVLEGEEPQDVLLDTKLIIRDSCGCLEDTRIPNGNRQTTRQKERTEQRFFEKMLASGDEKTVLHNLQEFVQGQDEIEILQNLRQDFSAVYIDESLNRKVEKLNGQVRDLINRRILALEGRKLWDLMSLKWRDYIVSRDGRISSSDMASLSRQIDKTCRTMKIRFLRMVTYRDPAVSGDARLVFSFPVATAETAVYDLDEVIPETKKSPCIYQVSPLYHQNDVYGYLVFQIGQHYVTYYEDIRLEISGALNTMRLLNELKETQKNLANAERQVAIGSLVKGMAHEISGPVGTALTAVTHISNKTDPRESPGISSAADVAAESLKKAATIITRLKGLQTELGAIPISDFSVKEWIDTAFKTLPEPLPETCRYRFEGFKGKVRGADPQDIIKIIHELAGNSLTFARSKGQNLNILVRVSAENQGISLTYSDDGPGVDDETVTRIFNPFFTTKRGTGHKGLGLPAVYSTVVTRYNGSIETRQPDTGGLEFEMSLPWTPVSENRN